MRDAISDRLASRACHPALINKNFDINAKIRLTYAVDGRIASKVRYQNMRIAPHLASRAPFATDYIRNFNLVL